MRTEAESLLSWNQVDAILIELANTVEESDMLAISVSAGSVPMSSGSAKANRAAKDKARADRDDAAKEAADRSLEQSLDNSNDMLVNSLSLTENSEDGGPPNGGGGGADGKAGAAAHADAGASAIAEESAGHKMFTVPNKWDSNSQYKSTLRFSSEGALASFDELLHICISTRF
eukprot:gene7126-5127_t